MGKKFSKTGGEGGGGDEGRSLKTSNPVSWPR